MNDFQIRIQEVLAGDGNTLTEAEKQQIQELGLSLNILDPNEGKESDNE